MIVYTLLLVTLLLAAISLAVGRRYAGTGRVATLLLFLCMAVFTYLYGAWVFLSVYVQNVFGVAALAMLVWLLTTARRTRQRSGAGTAVSIFFAVLFIVLDVLYFTGTTGKPYGVAHLSLPFRKGNYFVFQGGNGLPTNVFHYKLRGAVYAMDLVKLNAAGNRAKHIFSTSLEDYETYGDTLYSPCNGRILHTEADNPDNIPPVNKRGPKNTNHILIGNDSLYVFMAHLRPHCIFVAEGDSVTTGQPIACCGNSGFSIEPHLHIQAHARTGSGLPWHREPPLLITFSNRHYLLFERIKAGG